MRAGLIMPNDSSPPCDPDLLNNLARHFVWCAATIEVAVSLQPVSFSCVIPNILVLKFVVLRYRQVHNEIKRSLQVGYEFTCGKTGRF